MSSLTPKEVTDYSLASETFQKRIISKLSALRATAVYLAACPVHGHLLQSTWLRARSMGTCFAGGGHLQSSSSAAAQLPSSILPSAPVHVTSIETANHTTHFATPPVQAPDLTTVISFVRGYDTALRCRTESCSLILQFLGLYLCEISPLPFLVNGERFSKVSKGHFGS